MHIGVLRRTGPGEGPWGRWLVPLTRSQDWTPRTAPWEGKGPGWLAWPTPGMWGRGDWGAQGPRQASARAQVLFSNWVE